MVHFESELSLSSAKTEVQYSVTRDVDVWSHSKIYICMRIIDALRSFH